MKPGKPLARRSPLRAKNVSLKQGGKLPAKSRTVEARQPERAEVRAVTTERANGRCEAEHLLPTITCRPPLDTHERLSRARSGGTSQYDASLTALVCRPHHDYVTQNPAEAEALGLSFPSAPCAKSILLIDREESA